MCIIGTMSVDEIMYASIFGMILAMSLLASFISDHPGTLFTYYLLNHSDE